LNKKTAIIVIALLLIIPVQAILSLRLKSLTFDETSHLPAGYTYLKTGDFRLNLEQPPLIKLLAALPLLAMDLKLPLDNEYWRVASQYQFGSYFLYYTGNDAGRIILAGRIPVVLLSVMLAYFVFLWARKLYGEPAGLLALFLYAFCPNMLAHSRLVTMDFGAACFMFIACYTGWDYLEKPSFRKAVVSGVFLSLALVTKFSCAMLLPVFAIIFAYGAYRDKIPVRTLLKHVLVMMAICFMIIWASYGFRGDAFALYAKGIRMIYWNQSPDYYFYMNGKFSLRPWWYYYLFAFLIKTPVPTLVFLLASVFTAKGKGFRMKNEIWLLMPVMFVVVSSFFDSRNMGLRRILQVYPFLFVFVGRVVRADVKRKIIDGMTVLLCAWYFVGSLSIFPDYITYFNEFIGGPKNGIKYLDDSNIDWGEDLPPLKKYMDRKGIREIKLIYYGTSSPQYYGINAKPVREDEIINGPSSGFYAVSAHYLARMRLDILMRGYGVDWLRQYKPVARIGNAIYVYEF